MNRRQPCKTNFGSYFFRHICQLLKERYVNEKIYHRPKYNILGFNFYVGPNEYFLTKMLIFNFCRKKNSLSFSEIFSKVKLLSKSLWLNFDNRIMTSHNNIFFQFQSCSPTHMQLCKQFK